MLITRILYICCYVINFFILIIVLSNIKRCACLTQKIINNAYIYSKELSIVIIYSFEISSSILYYIKIVYFNNILLIHRYKSNKTISISFI